MRSRRYDVENLGHGRMGDPSLYGPCKRDEINDAIQGDRIACQFRKKSKERLIRMTENHRGTSMVISKNAYCVIECPMMRIN